jgi:hypothetical protein
MWEKVGGQATAAAAPGSGAALASMHLSSSLFTKDFAMRKAGFAYIMVS